MDAAIEVNRRDVIELLVEKLGADLEIEINNGQTALFTAVRGHNLAVTKQLLDYGACVNHKDRYGCTPLYNAVDKCHLVMIDLLMSYGADVNIVGYLDSSEDRCSNLYDGVSLLEVALEEHEKFHSKLRFDYSVASINARNNEHFDVIKRLAPHCKSFDVTAISEDGNYITMPSVDACFTVESQYCADLRITKFLLQSGATADFGALYETVKDHRSNADLADATFVKLCLLSGCTFNEYLVMLKQEKEQGPAGQDHRAKHVHALVKDHFSQPLTLQEQSIMAIRKSIGIPQLWAKIDALPAGLPRNIKDMIQLKTY